MTIKAKFSHFSGEGTIKALLFPSKNMKNCMKICAVPFAESCLTILSIWNVHIDFVRNASKNIFDLMRKNLVQIVEEAYLPKEILEMISC